MPLADDVTLRDLVRAHTLNQPVRYVRGLLENMVACRQRFGTATVQLGITGEGRSPHYRVSPVPDPEEDFETSLDYTVDAWNTGHDPQQRYAAFHGMSHDPLAIAPNELKGGHWSSGRSDFEEVQALLGELRGLSGNPRAESAP